MNWSAEHRLGSLEAAVCQVVGAVPSAPIEWFLRAMCIQFWRSPLSMNLVPPASRLRVHRASRSVSGLAARRRQNPQRRFQIGAAVRWRWFRTQWAAAIPWRWIGDSVALLSLQSEILLLVGGGHGHGRIGSVGGNRRSDRGPWACQAGCHLHLESSRGNRP